MASDRSNKRQERAAAGERKAAALRANLKRRKTAKRKVSEPSARQEDSDIS